ncbi:MAG TPA: efflux RND transporter permease subunit [Thermoanaerobaculia bacterium]|nr:efflux RND transporter permease subunit [Thermoanaerobaculia bacterium]
MSTPDDPRSSGAPGSPSDLGGPNTPTASSTPGGAPPPPAIPLTGLATLSIRRPVAVAMFFLGLVLLGLVAWQRMPVELFPAISGDQLFVSFLRPGSDPETIEREILLPLEARTRELPRVAETWGEVVGSLGRFRARFEQGAELEVAELELRRIAAQIARGQPEGTFIEVNAQDTSVLSSFAMMLQVTGSATGGADRNALYDLAEELVAPRLAAVPGVSQAMVGGGAARQLTVWVDPDRAAALGVTTQQVTQAVRAAAGRLRFVGSLEDPAGRTAVMLDGRPKGPVSLGEVRVVPNRPVLVRHVAQIEIGPGRERTLFRVDGRPSVGMVVFQEEGANLVRLGRDLRRRVEEIRAELATLGLGLEVSFDGAELVEEQIDRLKNLGLSGFAIALVVLYLFLRQWRAVAVVAVAVPVSLLSALAMLHLAGQSLNLMTLFGLAVGVGLLVDNSVVVYEAVQRQLEHGASADAAAERGIRRTVRAIVAASATTAVVFLPPMMIDLEQALVRGLIEVVALAILLPLFGSLLVAIGLVPLLARHLAAPAALRRLERQRARRGRHGGLVPPDPVRLLFSGLLASALRRPAGWITGVAIAVLLTAVIALPWVLVNTTARDAPQADEIQLSVRLTTTRGSLDGAVRVFERLEGAVSALEGVERVESMVSEEGGSLTIRLADRDERPTSLDAGRVRQAVRREARELRGVEILRPGEGAAGGGGGSGGGPAGGGGAGGLLGGAPAKVVLSGPDSDQLTQLANDVVARLDAIAGVETAWPAVRPGPDEIRVSPNRRAFEAFGLHLDDVLPVLELAGREGTRIATGYPLASGRELPIVLQRREARQRGGFASASGDAVGAGVEGGASDGREDADGGVLDRGGAVDGGDGPSPLPVSRDRDVTVSGLSRMRVQTPAGVLPVVALADVRQVPPAPVITHHNGRREREVFYRLAQDVPDTGPSRVALDREIDAALRGVHRPPGTTLELDRSASSTRWFRRILGPVVLLLFLVLAMTFESLTLPVLVLLSLPLTLLGSVWALLFAGLPLDLMAMLGALALFGLTVNPAILLVDRMQQRVLVGVRKSSSRPANGSPGSSAAFEAGGGWSAGAAALASVRERARPVLMTTATTVAGLWPLAIVTGVENEIWPSFATLVIGGLLTSTLLTLLIVPVGFVFLRRLDDLFGRVGPWVVLAWLGMTIAVLVPLFAFVITESLLWQIVTLLLVSGTLLGVTVLVIPKAPQRLPSAGPDITSARAAHDASTTPVAGDPPVGRSSSPDAESSPAAEPPADAAPPADSEPPAPPAQDATAAGPPRLVVRHLRKVYGLPGPVRRALRSPQEFARKVLERGGTAFSPSEARERLVPLALLAVGAVLAATRFQGLLWQLLAWLAAGALAGLFLLDLRRSRGKADAIGQVEPGGWEGWLAALMPWLAAGIFAWRTAIGPRVDGDPLTEPTVGVVGLVLVALVIAFVQRGRRTARLLSAGTIKARPTRGSWRRIKTAWRWVARRLFGLDLPTESVQALAAVGFEVGGGMVGVLGPNGAGKTTLLRQVTGILESTRGRILIGGVPLIEIRKHLARWVGYLPQDAGLPPGLTAREYLQYYGTLYQLPKELREERISTLLREVGLAERADERIGGYSGGMRQRVAVARTLLRLPPIIVVDEPTVGLDPRERVRFRNLLSRLATERIVLFSTHVVEDVAVACERVLVLTRGRLVFDGAPSELSRVAEGRVWAWEAGAEERVEEMVERMAEAGVVIADQTPEAGGGTRVRALSVESPDERARAVEPTLEDGYLWLVGRSGAGEAGDAEDAA